MKTSVAFAFVLVFSASASAAGVTGMAFTEGPTQGMAATQPPFEVVEIDLYALYDTVMNERSAGDGAVAQALRSAASRMANFGMLPIFGGYSNVNSEVNNERFVEPICRYLGYNSVEAYEMGWAAADRTPTVLVFTEGRAPYAYKMNLASNDKISLLRRLSCAKR